MDKIDLYKLYKNEYVAKQQPMIVEVGPTHFLSIVGQGAPGSETFSESVGALYSMAYTIKMTRKAKGLQDYVICKLECQYWLDNGSSDFSSTDMEEWNWRLLIRTPESIAKDELDRAATLLAEKGKTDLARKVCLFTQVEGKCVQMLHIGPYNQEEKTLNAMLSYAEKQNLQPSGKHHEIYLSDPRRVPPERLKTILRLPVS